MLEANIRQRLRQKPLLIMTHIVIGYPSFRESWALARAMVDAGVDLMELQITFSEPMADGPVILKANQDALAAGATWPKCLEFARELAQQVLIPLLFIFWVAGFVYRIAVRNIVMNSTLFDKVHPLYSDLSRRRFFWIFVSNFVITLLTLGLMRPWAAVREARYMAEHSGVIPKGDVGEIMASIQASGSAISAEYMDMEGMDFGF